MPGSPALGKRTPANRPDDSRYGRLREARRRRPYPLTALAVPQIAPVQPSKVFTKGSGVSAVSVASAGSGYAVGDVITIAGGTAAIPAKLYVVSVSSGAITGVSVYVPGAYTANPANPVAQGSTTGAGTGATFTLTFNAGVMSANANPQTISPTSSAFRFLGYGPRTNLSSSGYYGSSVDSGQGAVFEFATDAQILDLKFIGLNTNFAVFVDGKYLDSSTMTCDASGAPYLYSLTFADNTPRTIKIFANNMAFGGVVIGTADSVWLPPEAGSRPLVWSLGDSYEVGVGASNVGRSAILGMAAILGCDIVPAGISGSGFLTGSGNDPVSRINRNIPALTQAPDVVVIDLGYNDNGGNMTTVATVAAATITAIRAAAPNAVIVALGPATPVGATTQLDAVRTALMPVYAAAGVPMIDVRNWVSSTNKARYTGGDNTHPTQVGHDYLAMRRAQAMAPVLDAA